MIIQSSHCPKTQKYHIPIWHLQQLGWNLPPPLPGLSTQHVYVALFTNPQLISSPILISLTTNSRTSWKPFLVVPSNISHVVS